MPSDPMEALRKASSIGPGPMSQIENRGLQGGAYGSQPGELMGIMPMPSSFGPAPERIRPIIDALRQLHGVWSGASKSPQTMANILMNPTVTSRMREMTARGAEPALKSLGTELASEGTERYSATLLDQLQKLLMGP